MAVSSISKAILIGTLLLMISNSMCAGTNDSLFQKDYDYLFTRIRQLKDNTYLQNVYINSFLKKAKAGKDPELLVNAYKNYVDFSDNGLKIVYADSMVIVAGKSGNDKLIGSAYLSRGIAYYGLKRHELALQDYITASTYLERANDEYLMFKLKYNIAHERYYLGQNDEAIALFSECLHYFKENNPRPYLNTIHSMGLVYNKAGDYKKSEEMAGLGFMEAKRLKIHIMDGYFLHLDGLNQYFVRNYNTAISKFKESLPFIIANNDFANIAVANFYIGKSYWNLKKYRESIHYLKKVDDEFNRTEYIRPDLRENYELLIDFYKEQKDSKQVFYYVDQLLKADSILQRTHDHLYDSIRKNYDTKELEREKEKAKQMFNDEHDDKKILIIISLLLLSTTLFLCYNWQRNRSRQERIFRLLMQEKKIIQKLPKDAPRPLEITQDTVEKILRLLEKWELAMKFLENDITLATLAVYLETNTRYTSDIILFHRGKGFIEYLNDLKVDYIIGQLKTDKHKRMYTHDALAKEAGFSTTQRFVSAFKARTKISPNYFSAKIKKEMDDKNISG